MGENQATLLDDILVELLMKEFDIVRSTGAQIPVSAIATLGALVYYLDDPRQTSTASSSSTSSSASTAAQTLGPVLAADNERLRGRLHYLLRNSASARAGKASAAAHQAALIRHFTQKLHEVTLPFSISAYIINFFKAPCIIIYFYMQTIRQNAKLYYF